ncbi:MAG: DUF805 domain-containing protein [Nitratireductor sp.]|nr:DUF805 domain-containing protein [Nitratireductor sp.]
MKKLASLFSFSGKVKRARLLQFLPLALLLWLGAAYVDETWLAPNLCLINENWICYLPGEVREGVTLDMIVYALLMIPLFGLLVRRLHHHGRSFWWALLGLPLVVVLAGFLYRPEELGDLTYLLIAGVIFLPLLYWALKKGRKEQKPA